MRDEHALYAIEMEGAGVAESAWQFDKYYLVVRSACDYGHPKGDTWHRYAAAAAAAYTKAILEQLAP
jgi:nucleoside phosphorylase